MSSSCCVLRCCSLTLGAFVPETSSSDSTKHRRRRNNRETEAKRIEEEVFRDPLKLVLHWDYELIQSAATSRISEERRAVVLTRPNFEEVLGVPIAIDGTGRKAAAIQSIAYWYPIRLLTRSSFSPLTRLRPAVT